MADVRVAGLRKAYGSTTVVDNLNLDVPSGEFITLLGQSGCGKTTTLRCIAGLEKPDEGQIWIGDQIVTDIGARVSLAPERRRVGMVFQSYALWPHMTVVGNVAYPLRVAGVKRAEAHRRAEQMLQTLGLGHLANRPAPSLSGGQQQRVALGRAMVGAPRLVLFDEPLSNLDPTLRKSVRTEIRRLHDVNNSTSVYVTHDLEEALTLSDRIIVMHEGRMQQIGTPEQIYGAPVNHFVARFVGFENFLDVVLEDTTAGASVVRIVETGDRVVVRKVTGEAVGTPMLLAFRAAHVHPSADPERGAPIRVERAQYKGEFFEIEGTLGATRVVLTSTTGAWAADRPDAVGDPKLRMQIDEESAVLLPRGPKGSRSESESSSAGTPGAAA